MDVRRLLRATTCPLARKPKFVNLLLHTSTRLALHRGRTARHFDHTSTRQGSSLHSPGHHANHYRSIDRSQTSTFHSRSALPNHHRSLRPSLLNWRNRQSLKTSSASSTSPMAAASGGSGAFTSASRSLSGKSAITQSSRSLASSSIRPPPSMPLSTSARSTALAPRQTSPIFKPNNSSLSATTQASKTSNPSQSRHVGRERRHLAAMHRFRLQRQMKQMQRSAPRHSSQLLGLNGGTSSYISRGRLVRIKKTRRARRRMWRSSASASPQSPSATSSSSSPTATALASVNAGADGGPTQRYLHVHYYHAKSYPHRIRFLGFQHFLRHSKMHSSRGRRAEQRARRAYMQMMALKKRNSKFSWRRPFVMIHRKRLAHLESLLEKGDAQKAIRAAKALIKAKRGGAKLPGGEQLQRLASMDEVHYREFRKAAETGSAVSSPEWPSLQQFSTKDYNTILARCGELEDLGNGFKIARILSKRYQSDKFDFHAPYGAAPNTRTLHLLFSTYANCGTPEIAVRLFRSLPGRYPHLIPTDVYASFMSRVSSTQGKIPEMQSVIAHLQRYGPAPTATMYNMLLRARAYQEGVVSAEAAMKSMMRLGYSADQQTFRILINASLKELDTARAYHWLAEYGRQGFEVRPRMLETFMKTCVQQILSSQVPQGDENFRPKMKTIGGPNDVILDARTYSQEWMYKALQVIRYMSSQRIPPTAITFELLIEGFLSLQNLAEAKKVLHMMRGSPHLYTPAPRTWTLFFKHYLATDDHASAFSVLNEMRRVLQTKLLSRVVTVPPTALYHQLFRHLLQRGQLSLAEKSLYEMMIHQNRAQPSEKEVVDLIWRLDGHPAAAERVYELLYSQAEAPSSSTPLPSATEPDAEPKDGTGLGPKGESRPPRKNHIMEQGPIQMANVGVMRAKAHSKNELLQDEVWKAWSSMTQYFLEKEDDAPERPVEDGKLSGESQKERSVLALAFEQVAKAARKDPTTQQGRQQDTARESSSNRNRRDDWDFGQIRRGLGGAGLGLGLGLNPGLGLQAVYSAMSDAGKNVDPLIVDTTGTGKMNVRLGNNAIGSSKHQILIQQLLKQPQFLQPLLERRGTDGANAASGAAGIGGAATNARLENLKSSLVWAQKHGIPIRIEGFNIYLKSLISHQDFEATRESVEKYLLPSHSDGSDATTTTTTPSSLRFRPDVNTLRILNRQNSLIPKGNELLDQVLREGGPDLAVEWKKYLENPRDGEIRQNQQSSNWSTYPAEFLGERDSGSNSSADT